MRRQPPSFALLGAKPIFPKAFHVGRPNIGDRRTLLRRLRHMLDRRWLTNDGPFLREFEEKLARHLGVRHCVAMCNGTVALEIAIRASGMSGEVIVPGFTFIATAHALAWQGITPVFCDVDPSTHLIDPDAVEALITDRTTGIIGVHLWGGICDVEALQRISRRRNLRLIFDAAHAFSSRRGRRMVGSFGDAEVFSFHGTKFFNTFEGGAVTTNSAALAGKMRLMRNFGFSGYDRVVSIGTNGKMSEASAAMGLTNLSSVKSFIRINRENRARYGEHLSGLPGVRILGDPDDEQVNHQYVVLEIDDNRAALDRDCLVKILHAENVFARRYFFPGCHKMEPYREPFATSRRILPVTDSLCEKVMALPTGTSVNARDIAKICSIMRNALTAPSSTRTALRKQCRLTK